jgi:hypothetical protein
VGYRINSKQATHFRIWATKTLREFIIKGFVLDNARLKQGQSWANSGDTILNFGNFHFSWKYHASDPELSQILTIFKTKLIVKQGVYNGLGFSDQ